MSKPPRCDLHCHSTVSDGVLTPAELMRRAAGNGADVIALTDHDDLAGLAEARTEASTHGLQFINGVEISVSWEGITLHVVGLGVAPEHPALVEGLAGIRAGRHERARRIAHALAEIGFDGAWEAVLRYARNPSVISRTHFARFLVERRAVSDTRAVFERYLTRGNPGYVAHQWASLAEAVGWIVASGGVAVMAHPARYRLSHAAMLRMLGDFRACGGTAIEVVSGEASADAARDLVRLARRLGFAASCGSDFHAPDESPVDVGRVAGLPAGVEAVWEGLERF